MNTKALAAHYDVLTPWERLPLIVAASARADELEQDRLARSAPKRCVSVPNYYGLAEGLADLVKLYLIEQLDLAAFYWRLSAFLEQDGLGGSQDGQQREAWLERVLRLEAYRWVARADGWKQLCAGLHVDPEFLLREMPGYENLCQMDKVARRMAFSADEAVAFFQEICERDVVADGEAGGPGRSYRVDTAADVARGMHQFLQERLTSW